LKARSFFKKSFGIRVILFKNAVDKGICVEKDRNDDGTGNVGLKKRQRVLRADKRKYKGGSVHGKEKKGACKRKNLFHFFHKNHPLHIGEILVYLVRYIISEK
jgi:hypothetical protein